MNYLFFLSCLAATPLIGAEIMKTHLNNNSFRSVAPINIKCSTCRINKQETAVTTSERDTPDVYELSINLWPDAAHDVIIPDPPAPSSPVEDAPPPCVIQ